MLLYTDHKNTNVACYLDSLSSYYSERNKKSLIKCHEWNDRYLNGLFRMIEIKSYILSTVLVIVVQLLSPVWLFATTRTPACQVSLSFTVPQSLIRFMSIELVMLSNHLLCPWNFPGRNTGAVCHFLHQGIVPIQGLKPRLNALAGRFFTSVSPGKPCVSYYCILELK